LNLPCERKTRLFTWCSTKASGFELTNNIGISLQTGQLFYYSFLNYLLKIQVCKLLTCALTHSYLNGKKIQLLMLLFPYTRPFFSIYTFKKV
jgi:hypothetical protein